jgi:cell division protein FtsW
MNAPMNTNFATLTPSARMAGQKLTDLALYDRLLVISVVSILALGLLMVASASITISDQQFGYPFHFTIRQTISLLIGLLAVFFVLRIPIQFWQNISGWLLIVSFALLVAVLIPGIGYSVNGAARWISLGPIRLQSAELVKLFMITYLSGYLVRHEHAVRTTALGFIKPMIILCLIGVLLLLEPDFGSTAVIFATCLGMLFLAGARLLPFLSLFLASVVGLGLIAVASPYRLRRLTAFLDPWVNQFDSGYQLTQSLIAFGRGGWFGTGLGESIQKLFYLPEAHTDFLFAVLAEELGLLGMLTVIALFALFIYRGMKIGLRCTQIHWPFGAHLANGITLWLGMQALVNIGVNSGLLPTKGLTLPLMSYGGASLVISLVAIALLLRIDYEARSQQMGLYTHRRHT